MITMDQLIVIIINVQQPDGDKKFSSNKCMCRENDEKKIMSRSFHVLFLILFFFIMFFSFFFLILFQKIFFFIEKKTKNSQKLADHFLLYSQESFLFVDNKLKNYIYTNINIYSLTLF